MALTKQNLSTIFISFCFLYTQDGSSPLYVAYQNGHEKIVDTLLKNGANVNLATTVRKKVFRDFLASKVVEFQ